MKIKIKTAFGGLIMGLFFLTAVTPASAQILEDGGFENLGVSTPYSFLDGNSFGAWSAPAYGSFLAGMPYHGGVPAYQGTAAMCIGRDYLAGYVEQEFPTTIGTQYRLSFALNNFGGGIGQVAVTVSNATGTDLVENAWSPGSSQWGVRSFTFTASGTLSKLRIQNVAGNPRASFIDSVEIVSLAPTKVIHYDFNGNVLDQTGRGNNGTIVGSPVFVPAETDGGLFINNPYGQVNATQWVAVPNGPDLQTVQSSSFTMGIRYRVDPSEFNANPTTYPPGYNNNGRLLGTAGTGMNYGANYNANAVGGVLGAVMGWPNPGSGVPVPPNPAAFVMDGAYNWQFLVVDRATGQVSMYVDGNLIETVSGIPPSAVANLSGLHIGNTSAAPTFGARGTTVDEFCVWNYALTHAEIESVVSPNAPPTASAGGPYSGDFASAIGMSGASASDPDTGDTLTYAWTVNSAFCSFDDASLLNPSLTCTAAGNFTATLAVSDGVNPPVSSDAAVMVNKAATTTTVTCAAGPFTYTGAAQTPCSVSVTGPGGLSETPDPVYSNNTNAGTANASYTYAESANYLTSSDSENFTIDKAGLNVTPDAQQILIGSPDPTFTFSYSGFVNSEGSGVVDTAPTCGVSGPHAGVGSYTITCSGGVDNNYGFTYGTATLKVVYNFNGFFNPIDNVNQNSVRAGQGIPVKFSLNGNFGLNILAAGYPVSYQTPCSGTGGSGPEIPTVTAGNSSLSYDATADQYNYVWKTDNSWQGTCRVLVVQLNDGSFHTASFRFR